VNHRVLHGFTGRILAEKRYGVSDPEVLEAVACHVTGQPEMGIIAQIVFISDFTEENREGAFFDKIRAELSERGIVAAIRLACDMTAALVIDRGEALDVNTIRTRNWAVQVLKNGGKL
jgi:HD superfamily phosphohydrolase YqeK